MSDAIVNPSQIGFGALRKPKSMPFPVARLGDPTWNGSGSTGRQIEECVDVYPLISFLSRRLIESCEGLDVFVHFDQTQISFLLRHIETPLFVCCSLKTSIHNALGRVTTSKIPHNRMNNGYLQILRIPFSHVPSRIQVTDVNKVHTRINTSAAAVLLGPQWSYRFHTKFLHPKSCRIPHTRPIRRAAVIFTPQHSDAQRGSPCSSEHSFVVEHKGFGSHCVAIFQSCVFESSTCMDARFTRWQTFVSQLIQSLFRGGL
jgi:hypothetical protein